MKIASFKDFWCFYSGGSHLSKWNIFFRQRSLKKAPIIKGSFSMRHCPALPPNFHQRDPLRSLSHLPCRFQILGMTLQCSCSRKPCVLKSQQTVSPSLVLAEGAVLCVLSYSQNWLRKQSPWCPLLSLTRHGARRHLSSLAGTTSTHGGSCLLCPS